VVDEARWIALVAAAEERFGRLDVLANIAGISGRDATRTVSAGERMRPRIDEQSLELWHETMAINVTGLFLGTKHAIPAMRRAGGGSIVNISSICGIVGSYAGAAYHASKGAVRIFTKAGAVQHAADNIRMNSVHPGFIDTPMTEAGHALPEVQRQRLGATPLGRFGTPYDIAMGCVYLASDESAYMTGAELVIDGGVTAA
jgi:NAD(P)-dependent dehydrogenase (short-subunit alcohol dehydrogenase family)